MENFIKLQITNPTSEKKKCVLFGSKHNIYKPNFGSDTEINISVLHDNTMMYQQLIRQTEDSPFKSDLLIYESSTERQVNQGLIMMKGYDNGILAIEIPIIVAAFMSKNMGMNGAKITYPVKYDANTELSINIFPNTTLVLTIFISDTKQ